MASNSDGGGAKTPAKPAAETPSKKPAAIIDLKASDVDIRDPKSEQAASPGTSPKPDAQAAPEPAKGAASVTPPSSAPPSSGSPSGAATVTPATGATAAGSKPDAMGKKPDSPASTAPTGPASAAKPAPAAGAGKGDAPKSEPGRSDAKEPAKSPAPTVTTSPHPAPPPPSGIRGAATHLAAGLAGGLLALLGADVLATRGLLPVQPGAASTDLAKRVQALEASTGRPSSNVAELAQKLAAAEQRLARIDELNRSVTALGEQQLQLAASTKAHTEQHQQGADQSADARIAKLEETLTALSTAAANDPQRGRIPQLANLIGRLADLEASVSTQLAALRKSVTAEVDSRLSQATEASEAARSGTQRVDRELAGVKTESAQLGQKVDGLRTASDRFELAMRSAREDMAALKRDLEGLKGEISSELKKVARPEQVADALKPVDSRLAALESNVQGVVRGEADRRANAERIVLALELGNLKRTVDRGAPYAAELAEVRRAAGPRIDLTTLERHKDKGVPTITELAREFRGLAHTIIEADATPANASVTERLLAGAKSVVRIRRVDQGTDDAGVEAVVARIEANVKDGKLPEAVAEAGKLSPKALAPAREWLDKVEARAAVERAVAAIEVELKSALGAGAQPSQPGRKG